MRCTIFIVAAAAACSPAPARVSTPGPRAVKVEDGLELGWAKKRVITKQPPSTLIAQDGTICRVTSDRYKGTEIGRDTACDWQLGNPR